LVFQEKSRLIVEQKNFTDMKKIIFILAVFLMTATGVKAQTEQQTKSCMENSSLFDSYVRTKNYADAYPFWRKAYDECPSSTINIYVMGTFIINWQISQETDPAKKEALVDDMMKLFDDRIKYFGNSNPTYPKDGAIVRKVVEYSRLKSENADQSLIYKWIGEAIEEYKKKTDASGISRYMFASFKIMQSDPEKYKMQYVNDFMKCSNILDVQLAAAVAADKTEVVTNLQGYKTDIESYFFASGAAECDLIISIFTPKVEENKSNLEFLKETMTLFRRLDCYETDLYIKMSEYAYQIEPTADSALGLGNKAFKNNEIATAEKYYNEAIAMSDNPEKKAELYFVLGNIALKQNQYQRVKQHFQNCIRENPNHGKAYRLLASAYASGGRNIFPDDNVLSKCIWYAVVDKLERAKQLDSSIAQECNKQINDYSKGFPTKEEIHMHPSLEIGANFLVGGWVNETVKIR
jgi:tetratricopeptide (TPR) repeat protein